MSSNSFLVASPPNGPSRRGNARAWNAGAPRVGALGCDPAFTSRGGCCGAPECHGSRPPPDSIWLRHDCISTRQFLMSATSPRSCSTCLQWQHPLPPFFVFMRRYNDGGPPPSPEAPGCPGFVAPDPPIDALGTVENHAVAGTDPQFPIGPDGAGAFVALIFTMISLMDMPCVCTMWSISPCLFIISWPCICVAALWLWR